MCPRDHAIHNWKPIENGKAFHTPICNLKLRLACSTVKDQRFITAVSSTFCIVVYFAEQNRHTQRLRDTYIPHHAADIQPQAQHHDIQALMEDCTALLEPGRSCAGELQEPCTRPAGASEVTIGNPRCVVRLCEQLQAARSRHKPQSQTAAADGCHTHGRNQQRSQKAVPNGSL